MSNGASIARAWFTVCVLMVAYVVSFVDRQIMSLLIEPIRADLALSDTQFGLLHGAAFALFYALLGIPIASLTDRRSRPWIIAAGVAFWSLATAACGLARSFVHLLLARIGVGAGEAVLAPATYSLLADLFPENKLGRAVAVFSTGSFVGVGLAFLLGGTVIAFVSTGTVTALPILGALKPWQLAFVVAGLPGVLIALLIALTLRDPPRRELSGRPAKEDVEVWRFLAAHRGIFTAHYFGYSMAAMALFQLFAWAPAYLIRNFGLTAQESGYTLGPLVLVACVAGVLTSGWLMDELRRRGREDAPMRTGVIGVAGLLLPAAVLPMATYLPEGIAYPSALVLLVILCFFVAFPMPPSSAAMQILAPNRLRARVAAVFLFFNSLLGLALGSVLVGALTDYVFRDPKAVGASMSTVVFGSALLGMMSLAAGCRLFRRELARNSMDRFEARPVAGG